MELVYKVAVKGVRRDNTPVDDTVIVRATDGSIVDRIAHVHTAKSREVHNLNHGTALPGPTARTEGGPAVMDPVVNTNYDWLGMTWECYSFLFARDSYNNAGAKLVSSVHYATNYVNAFWNGTQMVYGDGDGVTASNLANSMDVTAHELTHAVTQFGSNLTYAGESGGLNEAMSDIFGNVCEWYRDGRVVSGNTWKVGEDVWTPGTPGDALRYMNTPKADGASLDWYPDYYAGIDVHYSSGIANLAFYLLSQGGTHPRGKSSIVVTGIGIEKAARVFYRANAFIMTSGTNFLGAKTATEQAASQLGYSTAELQAVTAAWRAVGVGTGVASVCSHNKCDQGASLNSSCSSCVASICASDSYCCSTSWDGICVAESRTICGSLTCAEAAGSCGHTLCTAGNKVAAGCDPSGCASSICNVDPYCCNVSWDNICVSEIPAVCGKNCN